MGAGDAHRALTFPLAVRAGSAYHAVALSLAVRAGFALRADVFQPAVRAGAAYCAVTFHPAVRATRLSHYFRSIVTSHSLRALRSSLTTTCARVLGNTSGGFLATLKIVFSSVSLLLFLDKSRAPRHFRSRRHLALPGSHHHVRRRSSTRRVAQRAPRPRRR